MCYGTWRSMEEVSILHLDKKTIFIGNCLCVFFFIQHSSCIINNSLKARPIIFLRTRDIESILVSLKIATFNIIYNSSYRYHDEKTRLLSQLSYSDYRVNQ